MNLVILQGIVTKDKELKYGMNGNAYAKISIAVNDSKKVNNEWVNETSFFDVKTFGKTAEKPISKGSLVVVEGTLKQEKWTKDGVNHYAIVVIANELTECIKNVSNNQQQSNNQQSTKTYQKQNNNAGFIPDPWADSATEKSYKQQQDDDDIPF
jgi:single-strand DNA-binding protein